MNFSDFITNSGKRICKEYYVNLIQVSKADGTIDPTELELLHKEGRKFGLTDPEIDKLIDSEINHHYNPPYSLEGKFQHLYNIAEMVLADDVVSEAEIKLIRKFAIEAGFDDKTMTRLVDLLLKGIQAGKDEESLLAEFRKKHLFRD